MALDLGRGGIGVPGLCVSNWSCYRLAFGFLEDLLPKHAQFARILTSGQFRLVQPLGGAWNPTAGWATGRGVAVL